MSSGIDNSLALNWVEDHFGWSFPFYLGGVGTMTWGFPFDIEGDPVDVRWGLPFNIVGQTTWSWALPFNLGDGALEMQWSFPFDIVSNVTAPVIGSGVGSGLHLTVAAAIGATSVTLSSVVGVSAGTTLQIGTATEYRVLTGVVGSVASFAAPLTAAYPAGTAVLPSSTAVTAGFSAGATTVAVSSAAGLASGAVVQVGTQVRVVSSVTGSNVTFTQALSSAGSSGTAVFVRSSAPVYGSTALDSTFLPGLLIMDKGGSLLGTIPLGYFAMSDAPSRTVNDSGAMRFIMPRAHIDTGTNPYLDLLFDDRLVYVSDDAGSPPWLGSITTTDWSDGQVNVEVSDCTLLWTGPKIKIDEANSIDVAGSTVYHQVLDLMNVQRGLDNEVVWDADIQCSEVFHGPLQLEGTAADLFGEISRRTVTEYTWRTSYSGGKAHATLVVRDSFTASGFNVTDGLTGNVVTRPRLLVDPSNIVNAVRVRGKASDLTTASGSCSTSGAIDCLDWMGDSTGGTTSPTQLIPEGFAEVDPGVRRRREEDLIELDWGLDTPAQQAAAAAVTAQAYALFHSFLRAWHDRYGRPFYVADGWQYDGPPADTERFLNTQLGWRTHLQLVEYLGQPASMVMKSDFSQQALLVLYDILTGITTKRRVWYTQAPGIITGTDMAIHGVTRIYTVIGGVVTEAHYTNFDHSHALVGPSATYMWPQPDGSIIYKSLRRVVALSEDGAVTEAMYFDSDPATGNTADGGIYVRPPFPSPPSKTFTPVVLPPGVVAGDFISKVYDFEDRSICSWDPRRDGVGALVNQVTIQNNAPTSSPRWTFIPWGDGTGSTSLSTGISATETQIYVVNAFVLPQTYPYEATLGTGLFSEQVKVTAGAGTLLTIERGINGTTAILHTAGESFAKTANCDQTPAQTSDTTNTVPWPSGQAWAEKVLAKLSKPSRKLSVSVVNKNSEWSKIDYGSLINVAIDNEGPGGGVAGTWRVLGWAPNFGLGAMELFTEEYQP